MTFRRSRGENQGTLRTARATRIAITYGEKLNTDALRGCDGINGNERAEGRD